MANIEVGAKNNNRNNEGFDSEEEALEREQYIKEKSRKLKEALIAAMNPEWDDFTDVIMDMNPSCEWRGM